MADIVGRRKVFIATCCLVILGAILSATAMDNSAGIYNQLCVYRCDSAVHASCNRPHAPFTLAVIADAVVDCAFLGAVVADSCWESA